MKIEINLPDPKYCNGCPCSYCLIFDDTICQISCNIFPDEILISKKGKVTRPKICIERHGE